MSRRWVLCSLLALVVLSAGSRVVGAYSTSGFDREDPRGMLRSDPALLYYLTERVAEAESAFPEDWRADPRIESGRTFDVPAELAVGEELLVGWSYRILGPDVPLHVYATWVLAVLAALGCVGVHVLAAELTGSRAWGVVAAALWCLTPANYRTVAFVLMREDLSVPLFLLHAGLGARALRTGSGAVFAGSALALVAALATWHAAGLLFAFEAVLAFAWTMTTRRAPRVRAAWVGLGVLIAGCLVVPLLRNKGALASPAMAFTSGVIAAALVPSRARLAGGVAAAVHVGASALFWPRDYGHVADLFWAKLVTLGQKPLDPRALSFDARLLWQGPFETFAFDASRASHWIAIAVAAAVVVTTVRDLLRGARGADVVLGVATVLGFVLAGLVERLGFVPGALAPVWVVTRLAPLVPRARRAASASLVAIQVAGFVAFAARPGIDWYEPRAYREDLRALLAWIEREVGPDEAVTTDFVLGPAILAHTGRAIALQPKYEAGRSRERARSFVTRLYSGTPDELAEWMRSEVRSRTLVLDRFLLDDGFRYLAGLSDAGGGFPEVSALHALLQRNVAAGGVRGFSRAATGLESSSAFRVWRLDEPD